MTSNEDYIRALEKLKGRDRIGVFGELIGTGVGAASGVAASGAIAGAAGASTLFGSSTLGSLLGGVFITSTPVGWVVGAAMAAAAIGYGITKAAHSGGKNDEIRTQLKTGIEQNQQQKQNIDKYRQQYDDFINKLQTAISTNAITQQKSNLILKLVESKTLQIDIAIQRIERMIEDQTE